MRFFNSNGGNSSGIYKSLNCGRGSLDSKSKVEKNLKSALKKLKIKSKKIILLNQTHSKKFYYVDKKFSTQDIRVEGDALITDQKNIPFSKKADIFYRIKRLIDKDQMGDLFKVFFITKKENKFTLGF